MIDEVFSYDLSLNDLLLWIRKNKRLKSNSLIPESFICSKCKELLIDPVQTYCGCRYCRVCFSEYYDAGNKECLNKLECDNTNLDNTTTDDKAATRDILRIIIKCAFLNCSQYTEIRNIKYHMETCEYIEELCILCKMYYSTSDKLKHTMDVCVKRRVLCPKCNETMTYDQLTKEHYNLESPNICLMLEGDCPNGCGSVILNNHNNLCERKPIQCPFPNCREPCIKRTIKDHLINENYQHLTALIETTTLQNKDIKRLEEIVNNKLETIQTITEKFDKIKKNHDTIDRRLSLLQINNTKNMATGCKKIIFRRGTLIWKVDNLFQLRTAAENGGELSRFSDAFYSSEFGYKLCIKVYPAGDGVGVKNYLSVYFVVMKGEYDELLSWPFRNKVTLSLLSPNKNLTENFKPDPTSACYQRPTNDCNVASGSPKFVKLDELGKFVIDGSIYLKMTVIPN